MAYSAAALTSAETTGFDNDKPLFVVQSLQSRTEELAQALRLTKLVQE